MGHCIEQGVGWGVHFFMRKDFSLFGFSMILYSKGSDQHRQDGAEQSTLSSSLSACGLMGIDCHR